MKVKTSITLSEHLLRQLDEQLGAGGNRSEFIEESVSQRLRLLKRTERDAKMADLYARAANNPSAHEEAEDALSYQAPWWELGDEIELTDEVVARLAQKPDRDATR